MQKIELISPRYWHVVFNDNTLLGWFATVAYAIAFLLALAVFRRFWKGGALPKRPQSLVLWSVLVGLLLFLGVNKQLDLQTAMMALGRRHAVSGGWYGSRRTLQAWFALGLMGVELCAFTLAYVFLRPLWRSDWLAFLGAGLLASFVAVRSFGMLHVSEGAQGVLIKHGLELMGILCIGWAAIRHLNRTVREPA